MQTDNPAIARQFERFGPSYRWLVTACGMMGSMTMVLSSTIVNVSIPSIMGAFGVGQDLAQWASTAFLTTMVASQLLNSWTSRVIGPRNTYLMALVIFSIGAVMAAISPSIEVLIAGRILQGFSAGLVQPLALATAVAVFPPERRGLAVGTVGMGIALAPTFGPLVGGITIDLVTWRHVFIVPLPLVGLSAIMALNLMPARNPLDKKPSFDWIGFILLCTALTTLMAGIGNGQRWGWESLHFLIFLLVGLASAVLFVVTQLRSKNPLLDPTLFLDARFASAVAVAFAFGVGNFSTNYSIPLFTQTIQGYTATKAGLVLVPAGLLLVALMQASGRLADRVPPHWPIIVGCSSFAVAAMVLATIDVNTAFITVALLAMFTRGSMSLISPNMGKAALSAVPAEKMAQGAGTFNFFRQMGGAFGVNMTAVTIEMRTAYHADFLTATQTNVKGPTAEMLDRVRELLNAAGVPSPADGAMALDYLGRVVYAQANTFAFHDSFRQIA
ncbi:MAG TPA: MFS transporter, partial [Rhodospirillaceae bacterium]|nr:MFS transporter [Rhodospirillaceae bacterium]